MPTKDGTLALTSDIPDTSNFVTTNTAQTISEDKTFTKNIYVTRDNEFHRFGTAYDGLVVNQPAISGKGTAYLEADKVGLYFGDPDTKTKNGELSFIEYWENDEGHTSSATANIHVASADQQTSSSVDIYLPTTSGTLALTSDVTAVDSKNTFQTTAPTAAITDGGIHIVYLSSEPATKYDGYIYLIAE